MRAKFRHNWQYLSSPQPLNPALYPGWFWMTRTPHSDLTLATLSVSSILKFTTPLSMQAPLSPWPWCKPHFPKWIALVLGPRSIQEHQMRDKPLPTLLYPNYNHHRNRILLPYNFIFSNKFKIFKQNKH